MPTDFLKVGTEKQNRKESAYGTSKKWALKGETERKVPIDIQKVGTERQNRKESAYKFIVP